MVCKRGVSKGVLPNIPLAKEIIYATATSILFHLAVVKPHKLKPSYFKFMNKITGNRYESFHKISAKMCKVLHLRVTIDVHKADRRIDRQNFL